MDIIIIGSSQVSSSMALDLAQQGFNVTIISEDYEHLQRLASKADIAIVHGRASYPNVLREANAEQADVLLAISDHDELNMLACQVAYSLFHIPKKIARIRSEHYLIRNELFGDNNLPVDVFINPEKIIARYLCQLVQLPHATYISSINQDQYKIAIVSIHTRCSLIGMTWHQGCIDIDGCHLMLLMLKKNNQWVFVDKHDTINPHDEIMIGFYTEQIDAVASLLDLSYSQPQHLMIGGGGNVGKAFASRYKENANIKIIERNKTVQKSLAQHLLSATILDGDITDQELMETENIDQVDLYCALSNDDQTNILSSLSARHLGAKRCITLVNQSRYIHIVGRDHHHQMFQPEKHTISAILSCIFGGKIIRIDKISDTQINIIELYVRQHNPMMDKNIETIEGKLPVKIACLYRQGSRLQLKSDTLICRDDRICILTKGPLRLLDQSIQSQRIF